MNINRDKIPNADDWSGYEADIEARYGHKLMFGKSLEELVYLFRDTSIERAAELLQMPRATVDYVASNQEFFDADVDIYGDFRDLAAEVEALCESSDARSAE